jgi:hypothetical protein
MYPDFLDPEDKPGYSERKSLPIVESVSENTNSDIARYIQDPD